VPGEEGAEEGEKFFKIIKALLDSMNPALTHWRNAVTPAIAGRASEQRY
jgi:hypothetical protein